MRSERQALAAIAKLCDEWAGSTRSRVTPDWVSREVRAIIADVQPEPAPVGGTIDRDALEEAWDQGNASGLDGWIGPGRGAGEVDPEAVAARARDVDRILAFVRPATIDRDALRDLILWAMHAGLRVDTSDVWVERFLALVRPVEGGVVLTREEASACAWALDHLVAKHDYDALRSRDGSRVNLRVLAERLEAAS